MQVLGGRKQGGHPQQPRCSEDPPELGDPTPAHGEQVPAARGWGAAAHAGLAWELSAWDHTIVWICVCVRERGRERMRVHTRACNYHSRSTSPVKPVSPCGYSSNQGRYEKQLHFKKWVPSSPRDNGVSKTRRSKLSLSVEGFGWFTFSLPAFKCTGVRFTFGNIEFCAQCWECFCP